VLMRMYETHCFGLVPDAKGPVIFGSGGGIILLWSKEKECLFETIICEKGAQNGHSIRGTELKVFFYRNK